VFVVLIQSVKMVNRSKSRLPIFVLSKQKGKRKNGSQTHFRFARSKRKKEKWT
jgi:hypothetical protein